MVINKAYGPNFQSFTGWEYLLIDCANYFGLDKESFQTRIDWTMKNLNNLGWMIKKAETPELFHKAVMSINRARRGEDIGHITYWDGCCSGIQIMSALTGCEQGAFNTGCIDPDKRMDAYANTTEVMNNILARKGLDGVSVPRSHIKQAVMTSGYGSKAVPKKVFGEGEMLDYFYEAAHVVAPGAFNLMDELLASWRPFALEHRIVLPDGFVAVMRVMETLETRVEIDELDHATFTMEYKENRGTEKGRANVANAIHCVDGYVLSCIERRCNYDIPTAVKAQEMLEARLLAHSMKHKQEAVTEALSKYIGLWEVNQMADVVIFQHMDWDNFMQLPIKLARKLMGIVNTMLGYKPFEVSTVHDA